MASHARLLRGHADALQPRLGLPARSHLATGEGGARGWVLLGGRRPVGARSYSGEGEGAGAGEGEGQAVSSPSRLLCSDRAWRSLHRRAGARRFASLERSRAVPSSRYR